MHAESIGTVLRQAGNFVQDQLVSNPAALSSEIRAAQALSLQHMQEGVKQILRINSIQPGGTDSQSACRAGCQWELIGGGMWESPGRTSHPGEKNNLRAINILFIELSIAANAIDHHDPEPNELPL
ncbi:hypothetical protein AOLI_G00231620 [Acnodon oligacanthus]